MRIGRRHGTGAPPSSDRHRWMAVVLVIAVLLALTIWIGVELSDWPPPPPGAEGSSERS